MVGECLRPSGIVTVRLVFSPLMKTATNLNERLAENLYYTGSSESYPWQDQDQVVRCNMRCYYSNHANPRQNERDH